MEICLKNVTQHIPPDMDQLDTTSHINYGPTLYRFRK